MSDVYDHIIKMYAESDLSDRTIINDLIDLNKPVYLMNTKSIDKELTQAPDDDGKIYVSLPQISTITPLKAAEEANYLYDYRDPMTECIDKYRGRDNNNLDFWSLMDLTDYIKDVTQKNHEKTGAKYDLANVKKELNELKHMAWQDRYDVRDDFANVVRHRPIKYDNQKEITLETEDGEPFTFRLYDVTRDIERFEDAFSYFRADQIADRWDFSFEIISAGQGPLDDLPSDYIDFTYDMSNCHIIEFEDGDMYTQKQDQIAAAILDWMEDGGLYDDNVITNMDKVMDWAHNKQEYELKPGEDLSTYTILTPGGGSYRPHLGTKYKRSTNNKVRGK